MTKEAVTDKVVEVAEQVVPALDVWTQQLLEWAKAGEAFAGEQLPLLVQEIISWGIASHAVWALVFMVPAVIMVVLTVKAWKWACLNFIYHFGCKDRRHARFSIS